MKLRPDLLDERSPKGIEVIQLTTEADVPSSHLYMEAQVFTPDFEAFRAAPLGERSRRRAARPEAPVPALRH